MHIRSKVHNVMHSFCCIKLIYNMYVDYMYNRSYYVREVVKINNRTVLFVSYFTFKVAIRHLYRYSHTCE